MSDILPIILSGGSGTRLWPLSRETYPKQFLPLVGDHSMLQATWLRVAPLTQHPPIIVANEEHRFIAAEQLQQLQVQPGAILLEPQARNTAPAIAVAALEATSQGHDPLLLVLPSDHVIKDNDAFKTAINHAARAALDNKLVTFGVPPTRAETGYGYLQVTRSSQPVQPVQRFVEKPDPATAEAFVQSGDYLWNSGMFMFRASRYLQELRTFRPDIATASEQAWQRAKRDSDFIRLDAESFSKCPSESVDYAVMEKTQDAVAVPLSAQWSDVGSWSAISDLSEQDQHGNATHGDVLSLDCQNTYAYGKRLIAMVGLQDIIVIETDDAVLVGHRDRMQDVKHIVAQIKQADRPEASLHRKVYRPWGAYDSIDRGQRFQVKRITVKPGATLSLQMHHHRAEHWIVVRGTAEVTRGDEVILLSENQSTYIPLGINHRLRNPGKLPLELIEVQSGSYLGEDDIVRFEDTYGRA